MTEKLQKVLARAGFGSRRQIEGWIQQGRIHLNKQPATLGDRISHLDEVWIDGRKVELTHSFLATRQVLCYHKPIGEVCTRVDPEGRVTVFEHLPKPRVGRWVAVGRLDVNTAGLLLLTTDGQLAHRLMHPSYQMEREYAVRILGEVNDEMLKRLKSDIQLEEGPARFTRIVEAGGDGANHWYHVILQEGRKREVRRLWEAQGVTVSRLIRIRFGPVWLPKGLRAGRYVELDSETENKLLEQVHLTSLPKLPARPFKRNR